MWSAMLSALRAGSRTFVMPMRPQKCCDDFGGKPFSTSLTGR